MKKNLHKILKSGKLAPFLSGLLVIFSLPPFNLGFLAYIALLPLLASFHNDNFYFGFEKGFIYGFVLNLGVMYWLSVNQGTYWYFSTLSMIASVLFLALFYGLAGSVVSIIGRRIGGETALVTMPLVFTILEWLRSYGTMGFTWNNLCYSQSCFETVMQIAAFTGPFGISLWIYVLNILIFFAILKWGRYKIRISGITIIVIIFPFLFGFLVLQIVDMGAGKPTSDMLNVTVVQPNINPNEKWEVEAYRNNMDNMFRLSKNEIDSNNTKLLVWPETAVPTYVRLNRRNSFNEIKAFLDRNQVALITGVPDYKRKNDDYLYYNAVFFMAPWLEQFDVYYKIHLVPFGEYIPLSSRFEDLKKLNLGQGNFEAGKNITLFEMKNREKPVTLSTAICFESSFPNLIRKGVKKGANLITIVTNDAWFANTSAPYLHAEIARFRAVENHTPVLRSANTGISMIIDKYGRIVKKSKFNKTDALSAKIDISKEKTFYSQTGNWIGIICVITLSYLLIFSYIRRRNENL